MKDIKTIEIKYLDKYAKPDTIIKLDGYMERDQALQLQETIQQDKTVFICKCWTDKNTFI